MSLTREERARREAEKFREVMSVPRPGTRRDGAAEVEPVKMKGVELSDVLYLRPGELVPNPLNEKFFRRESEDYFRKLGDDVNERGIIVPLIVRMDGTILAGHNRWKVACELGVERIPVQRVLSELPPEREKEFLIKDNYLRRQLSPEEKEGLIRELYGAEIMNSTHGGARENAGRRSEEEFKVHVNLDPDGPGDEIKVQSNHEKESSGLARRIEAETGIKAGTAKRIIAKIRKEPKAREPTRSRELTNREQKRCEKLALHIRTLRTTRETLEKKIERVKEEEKSALRELKSLGDPAAFGIA